jgi:hypothetical protein
MMEQLGQLHPGSLNTARLILAGCGTQTAALAFGGTPLLTGATEEYDGTSWTTSNPGSLNTARLGLGEQEFKQQL